METPLVAKNSSLLDEHNAAMISSPTNSNDKKETESKSPTMTTTSATVIKAPTLDTATVSTYASSMSSNTNSTLPPQPVTPDGKKSYRTLEEKENDPNTLRTVISMDEDTPHYSRKSSFTRYSNADDLSSSDDDSSYFATQLPAPNSRRGSYMSAASTNYNTIPNTSIDESNASLSFSDDESDEELLPNPHLRPLTTADDPITRMHSISSLVSSASSSENVSVSPLPKLLDGRQAPIMGQYYFPSPSTSNASTPTPPPMIMQGYVPRGVIYQPQAKLAQPGYGSMLLASQQYGTSSNTEVSFAPTTNGSSASAPAPSQGTGPTGGRDSFSDLKTASKIAGGGGGGVGGPSSGSDNDGGFKVYWQRWIMLMYMSVLNLLSDWTCYSVAPIAMLTKEAFGQIDPERLVVVFLSANAIASACEPIILARLGLRKTVLFGALLLMVGSLVKSGGMPPIIPSDLRVGHDEWRLYLGFFLVGLSQPLYQCTPALLSASWFPEAERTMATGVALNANQLGIGFAFIFGTLLVSNKEDIPDYFGLLTLTSTIVFLGTLVQFDDAPPTPPSASARVMRGTMEMNLPKFNDIMQSVRNIGSPENKADLGISQAPASAPSPATDNLLAGGSQNKASGGSTRRRGNSQRSNAGAPAPALGGTTADAMVRIDRFKAEAAEIGAIPPSPAMEGNDRSTNPEESSSLYSDFNQGQSPQHGLNMPPPQFDENASQGYPQGMPPPGAIPPYGYPPPYQYPYWDPRFQQQMQQQQAAYQQFYYYQQQQMQQQQHQMGNPPTTPYYFPNPYLQPHLAGYDWEHTKLPAASGLDEGVEPVITMTPHHLDIDIRDDQVILSIRACLSRAGFIHALVAFTVSGIVINTLSTYMDYLVRLNGAPRYYTGVVGGTFQFVIMISSLIIGKQTDKTRAYYTVTIAMLVFGAFGLAECGVSLDENNGRDLRWSLVIVAALVGPLQPVSTELGVDVAYPLSENTVLVIQQLFANLLSAVFIPIFKELKDIGKGDDDERPEYTFSFYLLIVLHTAATVFFATFNGKYLRYEHELEKKEQEEEEARQKNGTNAFHPFYADRSDEYGSSFESERQPLVGA